MPDAQHFSRGVLNNLDTLSRAAASYNPVEEVKAVRSVVGRTPMGHPEFHPLPVGDHGHLDAAAVFLDLDQFTARTFWEPAESVTRLALAVLTQVGEVVREFGGHVLGLRGDGLFACFGDTGSDPQVNVAMALAASAFALDATQNSLNALLEQSGLDPVRLRAGADHGRLDFVRVGDGQASEVNVVGFAANFAAKCEKAANSWELVVGQGLVEHIDHATGMTPHPDSPKTYTRQGQRRTYRYYHCNWRPLVKPGLTAAQQLAGRPLYAVGIH